MSNKVIDQNVVQFSENRIIVTIILFLIFFIPTSYIPLENGRFWLTLNGGIALLLIATNFVIWMKFKYERTRYFSLHALVMMLGMAFYSMTPLFKALFPSIYFWVLLIIVSILCLALFLKFDAIGAAFLNPQKKVFKAIFFSYLGAFIFFGAFFWIFRLLVPISYSLEMAIIIFCIGVIFLMLSPAMLVTPERAKELSEGKD